MSKAILVLNEMPKSCVNCTLTASPFDPEIYCKVNGLKIADKWAELDGLSSRPDWCPLKEMPERIHDALDGQWEYDIGWNECLDEISGTED